MCNMQFYLDLCICMVKILIVFRDLFKIFVKHTDAMKLDASVLLLACRSYSLCKYQLLTQQNYVLALGSFTKIMLPTQYCTLSTGPKISQIISI